jgi:hypothetical protein
LTAECVDDTSDGGLLALADEVEVEHALHSTGLQSAVHIMLEPRSSDFVAVVFSYYTKHRVLGWKSVCEAGGDMGRLGAAKRRMLSLAERPSLVEVADCEGTLPLAGAAEGIVDVNLFCRGRRVSLAQNWRL